MGKKSRASRGVIAIMPQRIEKLRVIITAELNWLARFMPVGERFEELTNINEGPSTDVRFVDQRLLTLRADVWSSARTTFEEKFNELGRRAGGIRSDVRERFLEEVGGRFMRSDFKPGVMLLVDGCKAVEGAPNARVASQNLEEVLGGGVEKHQAAPRLTAEEILRDLPLAGPQRLSHVARTRPSRNITGRFLSPEDIERLKQRLSALDVQVGRSPHISQGGRILPVSRGTVIPGTGTIKKRKK